MFGSEGAPKSLSPTDFLRRREFDALLVQLWKQAYVRGWQEEFLSWEVVWGQEGGWAEPV